jgi:hypothetical protein
VTDEFDPVRRLRPDRVEPDDPADPAVLSRAKERLMSTIDQDHDPTTTLTTPDVYPRLAYEDELAAVDYLTRVFGFTEIREATCAGCGWAPASSCSGTPTRTSTSSTAPGRRA